MARVRWKERVLVGADRTKDGGAAAMPHNVALSRESVLTVREALLSIVDVLERAVGLPRTSELRRAERRGGHSGETSR